MKLKNARKTAVFDSAIIDLIPQMESVRAKVKLRWSLVLLAFSHFTPINMSLIQCLRWETMLFQDKAAFLKSS